MNKRVFKVRTALNLSMEKFGSKIGLTRSAISKMEAGTSGLSEQTIKSICREFNVNEEWLRTGEGGNDNMFNKTSAFDRAYSRFGQIIENASPSKKAVLAMLLELVYRVPDEEWDMIMKQFEEAKRES